MVLWFEADFSLVGASENDAGRKLWFAAVLNRNRKVLLLTQRL